MAQQGNPFDQFDAPANAGPQVLIPESGVVTQGREVDLNNSRLTGQRTQQGIGLDAAAAARAVEAERRQRIALDAQLYTQGLRVGANGQPEPIPGWKDPKKAAPSQNVDPAAGLQRAINDMRRQFAAGPGATTGWAGALDLLPTQKNKAFDKAASAARGYVGPALGLTASQLNSPGEIEAAIGPYIPTSSDYDTNVRAAFERLQGLANDQRKRAGFTGPIEGQQAGGAQTLQAGQQTQGAMAVPGAGVPPQTPPQTPQGPAGYDVGAVAGAPTGGSGGGGDFASAAGVAMAKKLSQAYTRGAGVQELNKMLADNGFQTFSDPAAVAAIQKRGRLNFAPPVADDTRNGVGNMFGAIADSKALGGIGGDIGAYAMAAGDALTAGTLDNMAGGNAGLAMDYARQQHPLSSFAGSVTGGALAAGGAELGLGALGARSGISALAPRAVEGAAEGAMASSPWVARGGDALYGGAYGAGAADEPNQSRMLGAIGGAAGGLGGGMLGRGIASGLGGALRGVQNPDVQLLRQAKIPTTVGQTLGGPVQRIENSLSGIPLAGDAINSRYREGIAALRPAAVREAVAGVPNQITATSGREALDQGRTAVGNAYDSALGGVNLNVDPAYKSDLGSALRGANSLPGPLRDTFGSTLQNRVAPQFKGQSIDGRGLQAAVQGLRKDSGDLIRRGEIQSDLFADRATDVEEALFNMAERQVPGTPDALIAANRANRGMSIVEEASARALNNGGDFSAAQLGQAIKQNSRRFNGLKAMNDGRAPLQALQEAAQRVLPNSVPDSGTTGRAVVASSLGLLGGAGLGGGGGYAAGDATTGAGLGLGAAALLAAGGSKTGQRALVAALMKRDPALISAGNGIANRARIGGLFGAPMLAGAGASLATQ